MKNFQTEGLILSENAVKDKLEANYGFNFISCYLDSNFRNSIYILEDRLAKYVFKVYQNNYLNLEEIQGEVELLNILYLRRASVSYPLQDIKGDQIQTFDTAEGRFYGVLFSYAYGDLHLILTNSQIATAGRELAVIHRITSGLKLIHKKKEYSIDVMLIEPILNVKPAFKGFEEDYLYLQEISAKVIKALRRLDLSTLNYGYCHYDFTPRNIHFQENGKMTLFDFDVSGRGPLINDLTCFFLYHFSLLICDAATQEQIGKVFKLFLDSYNTISPLNDTEIESIRYFGFAHMIFSLNFRYDHLPDWTYADYAEQFMPMVKQWVELYLSE